MNITKIGVRFKRSRQPAPYEIAEAEVTLEAGLDEGEDATGQAEMLLDKAAEAVYARLGLKDPKGSAPPTEPAKEPAAEAPKKTRGRPKKEDKPAAEKPDTSDADIMDAPANDNEPAKEITDKEIQDACGAKARGVGPAKIKGLLTEFGVARSAELKQDQRRAFLDKLAALEA